MAWCSYCTDKGGFFSTNYVCDLNNEYIPSSYVNNYCKNYNKSGDCPFYKKYGPSTSSGCFITTVVCNILKKDDDDYVMQKLRSFRDNIMQKDEEYFQILKAYDSVGPIISCKLIEDKENQVFTPVLYSILEKITKLIDKEDYNLAVEKYVQMTLLLINRYNLKHLFNEMSDNNFGYNEEFDSQVAGHGKKLINPDINKN